MYYIGKLQLTPAKMYFALSDMQLAFGPVVFFCIFLYSKAITGGPT